MDLQYNYWFNLLTKAEDICFHNTKPKMNILKAHLNRHQLITDILHKLFTHTYEFTKPKDVVIFDKKTRVIQAPLYRDRIVQIAMLRNGLYWSLTKELLPCNCSCQVGRGPKYASDALKDFLREYYKEHKLNGYVLYIDVHDFYNSINHELLINTISNIDPNYFELIKDLIHVNNPSGVGLSLGSPTSALLANRFMHNIDDYITNVLGVKYYLRYCDDLVLLVEDHNKAVTIFNAILTKLKSMNLEANKKSCISKLKYGVRFLRTKFTMSETGKIKIFLDKLTVRRQKRHIRNMLKAGVSMENIYQGIMSWCGRALVTNSIQPCVDMLKYAGFVPDIPKLRSMLKHYNIKKDYTFRLYSRYLPDE